MEELRQAGFVEIQEGSLTQAGIDEVADILSH
jgi:hypothetical protein